MTTRKFAIVSVAAAVIMWLLDAFAYFPHVLIVLMLLYLGNEVESMRDELLNVESTLQDLQPLVDEAREKQQWQLELERDSISDQEPPDPPSKIIMP